MRGDEEGWKSETPAARGMQKVVDKFLNDIYYHYNNQSHSHGEVYIQLREPLVIYTKPCHRTVSYLLDQLQIHGIFY